MFSGRKGAFAEQWIDERGRRGFRLVSRDITLTDFESHLQGREPLGIYLVAQDNTALFGVVDIDVNKKVLLEYGNAQDRLAEFYQAASSDTRKVVKVCQELAMEVAVEDSGYKGRHIWFFFSQPVPVKLVRQLLRFILDRAGQPGEGVHWEIFPNVDKVAGTGAQGPLIKLPLGVHKRTDRRCLFLDPDDKPYTDQFSLLRKISKIPLSLLQGILLDFASPKKIITPVCSDASTSPRILSLLQRCQVIDNLVKESEETHYLNHAERLTLLYSIGQLGEEGKAFLHKTISHCLNYDYSYIQKQINKMKPYPISCPKIKEKHHDLEVVAHCHCHFRLPKNGYPSPILHAFKVTAQSYHKFPAASPVLDPDVSAGISPDVSPAVSAGIDPAHPADISPAASPGPI